jgi:hypothetical protein
LSRETVEITFSFFNGQIFRAQKVFAANVVDMIGFVDQIFIHPIREQCYKTFLSVMKTFCTKLERLLEQAGKGCEGQTLKLITKIVKLLTKQ